MMAIATIFATVVVRGAIVYDCYLGAECGGMRADVSELLLTEQHALYPKYSYLKGSCQSRSYRQGCIENQRCDASAFIHTPLHIYSETASIHNDASDDHRCQGHPHCHHWQVLTQLAPGDL